MIMKKIGLMVSAAALAFGIPSMAHAQEAARTAHPYIGVQVGLHDLGVDEEGLDTDDFDFDDSALIYGVYGGVDFNLGRSMVIGVEGNFNLGNGPIDSEYGVAARLGVRAGNGTVIFARAGYQWVDIDAEGLLGIDEDLIDDDDLEAGDTVDDYLVGVGADIAVGPSMGLRVAIDAISFDSIRPTIGAHIRF
jgi:opacity protein-like surface antigen